MPQTPDPNRMPPVQSDHVVLVHAVARMLGWTIARVHRVDDILRPTRAADGAYMYDVDRVLFFVRTLDNAPHVSKVSESLSDVEPVPGSSRHRSSGESRR